MPPWHRKFAILLQFAGLLSLSANENEKNVDWCDNLEIQLQTNLEFEHKHSGLMADDQLEYKYQSIFISKKYEPSLQDEIMTSRLEKCFRTKNEFIDIDNVFSVLSASQ